MNGKKVFWLALVGACGLGLLQPGAAWAWQTLINGTADGFDLANVVTVDGAGDVVAAGVTGNTGTGEDFTVVKLRGSNGVELWRQEIDGSADNEGTFGEVAEAVTVDAAGDAVVAGVTVNTGTGRDFTVVKLRGSNGAELWRQEIDGSADNEGTFGEVAEAVTVDAAGDAVAAGVTVNTGTSDDFTVVKLSGATGGELWRRVINGTANLSDVATAVTVDAAGDVVAAGVTENTGTDEDFTVVKLSGASGTQLWRFEHTGTFCGRFFYDWANAVTVDAAGDAVAAGVTVNTGTGIDFPVVKLSGADGSDGGDIRLISGKRLLVRDKDGDSAKRKFVVESKGGCILAASPGSLGDPTIGGGLLEVLNPTTGETDTFTLPAANWSGIGTPPGSKGYKYIDRTLAAGPCKKVLIRAGKRLKAVCQAAQITFSLDEPSQGSLGVKLTTGAGSLRGCMLFGGTILEDTPATGGETGVFMAKDAPPPAACPGGL